MRFYVTRYALTKGIQEIDGEPTPGGGAVVRKGASRLIAAHYPAGCVHETLEAAIEDAERRRNKKIASLKKSIKKLERTRFVQAEGAGQ
jgi:hypothetical protein